MGRHTWDVPVDDWDPIGISQWVCEQVFFISTSFTKLSVLVFYHRLLSRTYDQRLVWTVRFGIALVLTSNLLFFLLILFSCRPVQAVWLAYNPAFTTPYTCLDRRIIDVMVGLSSVITDFYALLLPELLIRNLHISQRQKMVLYLLLGCNIL